MVEAIWNYWPWIVVGLMALAAFTLLRLMRGREQTPYSRRRRLVTRSELAFYRVLRDAVDNEWEIFAMVRIADLLSVPKGTENHRSWLNKILSKHIDFVICDKDSLEVLAGIELDDPTHLKPARMQRDKFVNAAFDDAGLPLLRIPTADEYEASEIRKMLDQVIE